MSHTTPIQPPAALAHSDRFARRMLQGRIANVSRGEIRIHDDLGQIRYGRSDELSANVKVHNLRFYRHAILGGTLSIAESYLNGDWDCDDLTMLFRILIRNLETATRLDGALSVVTRLVNRVYHAWHSNTRHGSRRNIEAHYDLGNDFYQLWLDETLAYSCGIFTNNSATLSEASREKFDRACRRIALTKSDHVLEIGTGWGGFALHAAENYQCRVTTTTISRAQHDRAGVRIREAGLSHRITLLDKDYRDLTGEFDKLVSIEMIEAVGHRYLDTFFRTCGSLLRPDGSLLLQAIVMPERRYDDYLNSVDFIQRYIFPGGCLPSVGAMLASVGRNTDLRLVHVEDFAPHYAETLRRWRQRFTERMDDVRKLGHSERFLRLWHYYLCYCEAVFEERHLGVVQIQFDKPQCRRDALASPSASESDIHRYPPAKDRRVPERKEARTCPQC